MPDITNSGHLNICSKYTVVFFSEKPTDMYGSPTDDEHVRISVICNTISIECSHGPWGSAMNS